MGTNVVHLVGRVSAPPQSRVLPSGDEIITWRLVVAREPPRARSGRRSRQAGVDTLDCAAFSAPARRSARGLAPGELVEVDGALRRRFWRGPGGPASRCEVEAAKVRRAR